MSFRILYRANSLARTLAYRAVVINAPLWHCEFNCLLIEKLRAALIFHLPLFLYLLCSILLSADLKQTTIAPSFVRMATLCELPSILSHLSVDDDDDDDGYCNGE